MAERDVVHGLPPWLRALVYDAKTGRVLLSMQHSATQRPSWPMGVSMTIAETRALIEALGRCVDQSARVVLDVNSKEKSDG